jgi:DNA-binding XRE family transcriptional regulator
MTHAYSELYLNDARKSLATALDYAINDCQITADEFMTYFLHSPISKQFEIGNPSTISGKSGIELASSVLNEIHYPLPLPSPRYTQERSPEYWAGWALAYYQWWTAKRFMSIFARIPLSEIVAMYPAYHEMDITQFVESMENKYASIIPDTKLRKIRQAFGLSQKELADKSDVSLRNIQLYEQRVNDIDKAQAKTLYKLARALGCQIEDLLENPEQ